MELLQIIASIIFLGSIVLVITGWIDSVIAAILGIIVMILFGVMTEVQAFQFVDWNVILILLSIWIISGYFGKSGVPDFLADYCLENVKRQCGDLCHLRRDACGFCLHADRQCCGCPDVCTGGIPCLSTIQFHLLWPCFIRWSLCQLHGNGHAFRRPSSSDAP